MAVMMVWKLSPNGLGSTSIESSGSVRRGSGSSLNINNGIEQAGHIDIHVQTTVGLEELLHLGQLSVDPGEEVIVLYHARMKTRQEDSRVPLAAYSMFKAPPSLLKSKAA